MKKNLSIFLLSLTVIFPLFATPTQLDSPSMIAAYQAVFTANGTIQFPNAGSLEVFLSQLRNQGFQTQDLHSGKQYTITYQGAPIATASCSTSCTIKA